MPVCQQELRLLLEVPRVAKFGASVAFSLQGHFGREIGCIRDGVVEVDTPDEGDLERLVGELGRTTRQSLFGQLTPVQWNQKLSHFGSFSV
jgi:hypothetical protein